MNLHRLFTDHPASVGESYLQHQRVAARFGLRMAVAGLACLLHAVLPFLFVRTASRCVERLHAEMLARRQQKPLEAPGAQASAWRSGEPATRGAVVSRP